MAFAPSRHRVCLASTTICPEKMRELTEEVAHHWRQRYSPGLVECQDSPAGDREYGVPRNIYDSWNGLDGRVHQMVACLEINAVSRPEGSVQAVWQLRPRHIAGAAAAAGDYHHFVTVIVLSIYSLHHRRKFPRGPRGILGFHG